MPSDSIVDRQRAFVVAAHPALRVFAAVWALMLIIGFLSEAASLPAVFGDAPLPVRIIAPIAYLGVVAGWTVYGVRMQTVLRVTADTIRVERRYPPLHRTFSWQDVDEWRIKKGSRGSATLRIRFADGHRVTIHPSMLRNAGSLITGLEVALPASGTSVRIGRRADTALAT